MDKLYLFRDHYFESHEIDDAVNKNANVEKEMKDTLSKFDECKGYEIDGARAKYYYLKGKALNVVERYIPQAEELLSKSVKLDPKLIEAWNELGECYWKNNDLVQAKNCFSGALLHVSLLYHNYQGTNLKLKQKNIFQTKTTNLLEEKKLGLKNKITVLTFCIFFL